MWWFLFVSNHNKIEHNFSTKRLLYINLFSSFSPFSPIEESEAASKQVLAKSEQIRKFQEENKYLGQLVSLVRFKNCFQVFLFSFFFLSSLFIKFGENKVIKLLQGDSCPFSQSVICFCCCCLFVCLFVFIFQTRYPLLLYTCLRIICSVIYFFNKCLNVKCKMPLF